jgi:hypothetical protein
MTPDETATSTTAKTAVYQELCNNYRAIDDLRTKLLGLLPFATGAGVFILVKDIPHAKYLGPIGAFGLLVTLGLFSYELHGIKKCGWLIRTGITIEKSLGISGPFLNRPHEVAGFIDEPFAASVIYPASLAAWAFLALAVSSIWAAVPVAVAVFVVSSILSLRVIRRMEGDLAADEEYSKEGQFFTSDEKRQRRAAEDAERRLVSAAM